MSSFRLEEEWLPAGLVAVPFAAACCWWLLHVRRLDLGENDFAGLFYLLSSWFLLVFAVGLALAGVGWGIGDLYHSRCRFKTCVNLLGGVVSLLLVAIGAWL